MIHLTLQQLSAFLDSELTDASTELIRRHLSECDACTLRFARIEAQEEVMVRILVDEPGEEFFAELSESIARDIGGGKTAHSAGRAAAKKSKSPERKPEVSKPASAPKPAPPPTPPPPPTQEPARTVIYRPEPEPKPLPIAPPAPAPPAPPARTAPPMAPSAETRPALYGRRDDDAIHGAPGAGRATSAWIAAAVICVLVGSAAWIGLRGGGSTPPAAPRPATEPPIASVEPATTESPVAVAPAPAEPAPEPQPIEEAPTVAQAPAPDASPTPAPAPAVEPRVAPRKAAVAAPEKPRPKPPAPDPERLVERPPQNLVPVRTIITETMIGSPDPEPDVPSAAPAPPAQTAPSPARLFQDAKGASLRAAKSKEPVAFDAAASAWERAIPLLSNSPEDLAMARRELAQARYQAWAEAPTPARRVTAITATRAYLLYAPPGPDRDQAWTWLGRLKH